MSQTSNDSADLNQVVVRVFFAATPRALSELRAAWDAKRTELKAHADDCIDGTPLFDGIDTDQILGATEARATEQWKVASPAPGYEKLWLRGTLLHTLYETVYPRCEAYLTAIVRDKFRDPNDVDDVMQSARQRIIERFLEFPIGEMSFLGWMAKMVRQAPVDLFRRRFAQKRDPNRQVSVHPDENYDYGGLEPLAHRTTPTEALRRAERTVMFDRVLMALNVADREIIIMVGWVELSNEEITEILQITPAAARKRIQRARERFVEKGLELYPEEFAEIAKRFYPTDPSDQVREKESST